MNRNLVDRNRSGSFLMEFVLYLGLFFFLLLLASQWLLQIMLPATKSGSNITRITPLASGLSAFYFDACAAPSSRAAWKKIAPHALIWLLDSRTETSGVHDTAAATSIGWLWENGSLVRKEGAYNPDADTWHNVTTALIHPMVMSCRFDVDKTDTHVHGIRVLAEIGGCSLQTVVTLRNRHIVKELS